MNFALARALRAIPAAFPLRATATRLQPRAPPAPRHRQAAHFASAAASPGSAAPAPLRPPVRVAVTGAAGAIGYALLMRIAAGDMLGPRQPIHLNLLELPQAIKPLQGVVMELQDGAFPLLHSVTISDDLRVGFADADICILVGAKPRGPGMERADLMSANAKIFEAQGKAINEVAKRTVKVLVVGNPANTNALVTSANAPNIPPTSIHAMMRLDQNRALAQVALKAGTLISDVKNVIIWGNHSVTQYPDVSHATIRGKPAKGVINDDKWIVDTFIPTVQKRGAAIIAARGASSAASAANAAIDHVRDWILGTDDVTRWNSMAVPSDGSTYGIESDLWYSVPCANPGNGQYKVIDGLDIDEFSRNMMVASMKELKAERDMVMSLLPKGWPVK